MNRRAFLLAAAGAAALPRAASTQSRRPRVALYASVGAELTHYDVDVPAAALERRGTVLLPAAVQYAWPHASRQFLYAVSSDTASGAGATPGTTHHLSAWRIAASGGLAPHGRPVALPSRPIHVTTDIPSRHALVAFNSPSAVRVYRINPDGTPGDEVTQPEPIDAGIYGHQVRVRADNRMALLVARGNDATDTKKEDPGAVKVFSYRRGLLTREASIAPDGGYGFGPRHLDFHPTRPWVYVSIERQNRLNVYRMERDRLNPEPLFSTDTLEDPLHITPRQIAGAVHVHPNGRFVYGVNRADGTITFEGRPVLAGGENTLVAYAIDQTTGEPMPRQHVDTRGIHARTFHIDPSGRLLVAANMTSIAVRTGATVRTVPACLSMFRIGGDGTLDYVRKYDVEVGDRTMFWMGMVP